MASIRALCRHGVLLENGMVKKTGNINEVVDFYLGNGDIADDLIVNDMKVWDENVQVKEICVNGSKYNHIAVSPHNSYLDIMIRGALKKSQKMSMEIRLKDLNDLPLLLYSPFHGDSPELPQGDFELRGRFALPKGMTKGLFIAHICLADSCRRGLVDLEKAFVVDSEGVATPNGYVFDYGENMGFICANEI